jgi:mono/diheme cytochrome c family protein
MTLKPVLYLAAGALGALVLGAVGVGGFVASGIYDLAALRPHTPIVQHGLNFLQQRSVSFHARGIQAPPLDDPRLVQHGFGLYRTHCVVCHGAPGEGRERVGIGLNPNPPPLIQAIEDCSEAELYWITANGLKMAGMPGFNLGRDVVDLWAIVAFMRRMNGLSPQEYRHMVMAADGQPEAETVHWVGELRASPRHAFTGDSERGKELLRFFGCSACHTIPGVVGANGLVGPPLMRWAERQYITGRVVNTPANLVEWIVNPQVIEPGTAMPATGATAEQARDIAAYLYTLGRRPPWLNGGDR